MSMLSLCANGLWTAACLPEALVFRLSANTIESTQRRRLSQILGISRQTEFGRRHHFDRIRSAEDYRAVVPLSDYEAYRPAIEAMMKGDADILTSGRPVRLVPTSGSSAASKLIPYTAAFRREFQNGLAPWIVAHHFHHPACLAGTAYWSISPAQKPPQAPSIVPIGFDDDTHYLNPFIQRLLATSMAVPPFVARITDMDAFRYVTLLFLLKARDLTFVSVWNPTYFSLLLDPLETWWERLADDLEAGYRRPDSELPPALRDLIRNDLGRHPDRAAEIRSILSSRTGGINPCYARIWPRLTIISCWTDAAAEGPAADLKKAFPETVISSKGLLATEGMVSIPIGRPEGSALAIRSHFYEFLEDNDPARTRFAWQLEAGHSYAVVLTTGGGFYRYRLGDTVRVTGFLGQCPLLRFTGRCDTVSDWYGEKLHESHVGSVVSALLAQHKISASFAMLVPDGEPRPGHYMLLLAGMSGRVSPDLLDLESELDVRLCANFHYEYCRRLGQLKPVQIKWLACGAAEANRRFLQACLSYGQKAGEIKPVVLDRRLGWLKALDIPARGSNGEWRQADKERSG